MINIFLSMVNKLGFLDRYPSRFTPNFNSRYAYGSNAGGILTIFYVLIVLFILIFKFWHLVERQNVYSSTEDILSNDLEFLDISSADFRLRLFGNQVPITFNQLASHGLNVIVLQQNLTRINNKSQFTYFEHEVSICKTGLNRQNQICFPETIKPLILGRLDFQTDTEGLKLRRFSFVVQRCDSSNPKCSKVQQQITYIFQFHNNKIATSQLNHTKTVVRQPLVRGFQSESVISDDFRIGLSIEFKRAIIITDNSIWPVIMHSGENLTTQTWFYDQENFQEPIHLNSTFSSQLLTVRLIRSGYTHIYKRRYDKIDDILAQVNGLMAAIGLAFFWIYYGYNGWSFQQNMRRQLGYKYTNPSLIKYYRYLFLKFCNCRKRNELNVEESLEQQSKFSQQLDFLNLINNTCSCKSKQRNLEYPSNLPIQTKLFQNLPEQDKISSRIQRYTRRQSIAQREKFKPGYDKISMINQENKQKEKSLLSENDIYGN